MKHTLLLIAATIGFGLTVNAQQSTTEPPPPVKEVLTDTTTTRCSVTVFESENDLRYTNECTKQKIVKITYSYGICKQVSRGGKVEMTWTWSEPATMKSTLEPKSNEALVIKGNNCLKYRLDDWEFVK